MSLHSVVTIASAIIGTYDWEFSRYPWKAVLISLLLKTLSTSLVISYISLRANQHGTWRRLPVHLHEMMSKAKKAERNLSEELAREPSRAEVASRAGLSEARLHSLSRTYRLPSSMDAPLRQGAGSQDVRTLEDYVEDDTAVRTRTLHASGPCAHHHL